MSSLDKYLLSAYDTLYNLQIKLQTSIRPKKISNKEFSDYPEPKNHKEQYI